LLITKFIKHFYYPDNQNFKSVTELIYDKDDLFVEMKVDDSSIINVELIKK